MESTGVRFCFLGTLRWINIDFGYSLAQTFRRRNPLFGKGAVQNGGGNQATLGRYTGIHSPLLWRITNLLYTPKLDAFHIHRQATRLGALPLAKLWKPVQNINKTCTPSADHQPRTTAFPRRFCGQNQLENTLPRRPDFPRFLTKSVTSPLEHFFVTFFAPFCPYFSLVRSPKNRNVTLSLKMQRFRDPFRSPRRSAERPSLSHRNDEPESPANAVQNWRRPRIPARPRKPTCIYESIPKWWRTFIYLIQRQHRGQSAILSPPEAPAIPVPRSLPPFLPQIWTAPAPHFFERKVSKTVL